jgi:sulfatase modifying factor 1
LVKSIALVPELRLLPGGDIRMGDDAGREDERPAHVVALGPFRVAADPVTNAEYSAFVASTGYVSPPFWEVSGFGDPRQPVVGVSWFDAVCYCDWLSNEAGRPFRLPTEAEREYAARGGLPGAAWPWGERAPEEVPDLAPIVRLARPHVPAACFCNGFGLRCLADNVHEWCSDWYDAGYYAVSPAQAPQGPETGRRRASRGGSWRHQVKFNRCAARSSLDPSFRYNDYGFRVYADV